MPSMKCPEKPWPEEMMSPEQRKACGRAYNHLISNESRRWDGLDDYICYLEYLDDDQLHREADVIFEHHSRGTSRCPQEHPIENCFVPVLIEAAGAILELYKETNSMHPNNRYILQYYLAMNQGGMILIDIPSESAGDQS